MNYRTGIRRGRRICGAILGIAMLVAGTVPLAAQGWMNIFGRWNAVTSEASSAIELPNGDIIAVGIEGGTLTVLRTDAQGIFISQDIYPIDNLSGGTPTDVAEIPGTNDIVIVGDVYEVGAGTRGFVLRTGATQWVKIFNDASANIELTGVVVTQYGGAVTSPGDIVFSGRWKPHFGGPKGMLGRIDASGAPTWWVNTYDITLPGGGSSEQLEAVDEARIGPGAGDIVATGPAFTFGGVGDNFSDIWVLRVNGDNGSATGPGLGSALYSTPGNFTDHAASIQELRSGPSNGDLIIAGSSNARGAESVLLLQTTADPCTRTSDALIWDNSGQAVVASGVCEIPPGAGGNTGNIIAAGTRRSGPLGNIDILTQEVQAGSLALVGQFHYYGGDGDDIVRSISPVLNAPTTNGFILAGHTTTRHSSPTGNTKDIFLVKIPNCLLETRPTFSTPAGMTVTCLPTAEVGLSLPTSATTSPACINSNEYALCVPGEKRVVPEVENPGAIAGIAALKTFPSPVSRGTSFTLGYALTAPGKATITVADIAGRIVYQTGGERSEGHTTELIPAAGWSAGTYLVTVAVGERSATSRIVVTDR